MFRAISMFFATLLVCGGALMLLYPGFKQRKAEHVTTAFTPSYASIALSLLAFVGVIALTRVYALGVFVGILVYITPPMYRQGPSHKRLLVLESLLAWVQRLHDSLRSRQGLEQALRVASSEVPNNIAPHFERFNAVLRNGTPSEAVLALHESLNDSTLDSITGVLYLSTLTSPSKLADQIGRLGETLSADISAQRRVNASRGEAVMSVRLTLGLVIFFDVVGFVLGNSYLGSFRTPLGEMVVVVAGLLESGGVLLMRRQLHNQIPKSIFMRRAL